jgi:glucose/arabinose dehydrogenase
MLIALLLAFVACSGDDPTPSDGPTPAEAGALPEFEARPYASKLDFPVDMAWERGTKRIFFTEKTTGKVKVMVGRKVLAEPCIKIPVATDLLEGMTGIVLAPGFTKNHWLYVFYTKKKPHENRVTRFEVRHNKCINPKQIVTGLTPSRIHNGGQLEFIGDKLFVSTGDAGEKGRAQDTDSLHGKILRLEMDGSIPEGNPFSTPGSPNAVWSYGHRNPFGLALRLGTNQLYETENGPNCDDELNIIKPGKNYGWGDDYGCGPGVGEDPKKALKSWTPTIVPADLWWYKGTTTSLNDALYMAEYVAGKIHRFELSPRGRKIISDDVIYDSEEKLVDVSKGPGGHFFFMTQSGIFKLVEK